MTNPASIEYARPDLGFVRRREFRIGVWSWAIAIATLLIAGPVTYFLAAGAWSAHQQMHPSSARVAKLKADQAKMHAQNQALFARQRGQLVARLTAEAAQPPFGPLTDADCDRVIGVVESQANRPLTPQQKATFVRELKKSDQTLVDPKLPITADKPARTSTLPLQTFYCEAWKDFVQIRPEQFYSSQLRRAAALRIAADGSIAQRSPPRPTSQETLQRFDEMASRPDVIGDVAAPPDQPQGELEMALGALLAIFGLLQIGLAVLLLIAGTNAFRSDERWRGRHRGFAIGQLLIAMVSIVAWLALYAVGEPDDYHIEAALTAIAVGLCAAAMIYPIVLLNVVRRSRSLQG